MTVSSHAVADAMRDKQANASDKETSKSSSSSKRSSAERKGKNGKQKIKQKQQPPPPMSTRTKDGEETGDEDAPEGSRPKRSGRKVDRFHGGLRGVMVISCGWRLFCSEVGIQLK